MKIVLINGIEVHAQSDAEIETILRWLGSEGTFSVPSTHSGLRAEAAPMTDDGEKEPET